MLYPMLTLMFWTLCVAIYLLLLRVVAVRQGQASISYFKLNRGDQPPPVQEEAVSNHYDNLFQMPMLFYVAGATCFALGLEGPVALAWGYVLLRVIHGVIHMSYNKVLHRLGAFLASNLVLLAIWASIALSVG